VLPEPAVLVDTRSVANGAAGGGGDGGGGCRGGVYRQLARGSHTFSQLRDEERALVVAFVGGDKAKPSTAAAGDDGVGFTPQDAPI
jgi:hypothetical protein